MATPPTAATVDYNKGYLKTPAGMLRIAEGVLAVVAIICCAEGSVCDVGWNYGFFIVVSVISIIESIAILVLIVLRYENRIPGINVPLSIFLTDAIRIAVYFLATVTMMLNIGKCRYMIGARIVATLTGIGGLLILVGLTYTDFKWWKGEETPDSWETKHTTNGIPVTSSSTAVLNLS